MSELPSSIWNYPICVFLSPSISYLSVRNLIKLSLHLYKYCLSLLRGLCYVSIKNILFFGFRFSQWARCGLWLRDKLLTGTRGWIRLLGLLESDRRCVRSNKWYCFLHGCVWWTQAVSFCSGRHPKSRLSLESLCVLRKCSRWWYRHVKPVKGKLHLVFCPIFFLLHSFLVKWILA